MRDNQGRTQLPSLTQHFVPKFHVSQTKSFRTTGLYYHLTCISEQSKNQQYMCRCFFPIRDYAIKFQNTAQQFGYTQLYCLFKSKFKSVSL